MSPLPGGKWTFHREEERLFVRVRGCGVWVTENPVWRRRSDGGYEENRDRNLIEVHSPVYGCVYVRGLSRGVKIVDVVRNKGYPSLTDVIGIDGLEEAIRQYERKKIEERRRKIL